MTVSRAMTLLYILPPPSNHRLYRVDPPYDHAVYRTDPVHVMFSAMQRYRRRTKPGGTFFFTLVTYDRRPFLTSDDARKLLRTAIEACRRDYPFTIDAFVLMPDHLHCLWRLPPGDADYSTRWRLLKASFTNGWLEQGNEEGDMSASRKKKGQHGVWQRRFWEHTIRDDEDYWNHAFYIHWNPVKHGLVRCPHEWPYSSFRRWVEMSRQSADWRCRCRDGDIAPEPFDGLAAGE